MDIVEELKKKLENIKRDLDQEKKRSSAYYNMIMKKVSTSDDDANVLQEDLYAKEEEIASLKRKLSNAVSYEQEVIRLRKTIEELTRKLSAITQGHNWRSAVNANLLRSHKIAAEVICNVVRGLSVKKALKHLEENNLCIDASTAYRAISVKADGDKERIFTIFTEFPEVFDSYHISEQELLTWFEKERIKKLHLLSEQEVIESFGKDALKGIVPDKYAGDIYFNPKAVVTEVSWGE